MNQYTYNDFLRDHTAALISMQVPELYWPSLHNKLLNKIFDAPATFELGMLNYTSETTHAVVKRELFVSVKVDEVRSSDPNRFVFTILPQRLASFWPTMLGHLSCQMYGELWSRTPLCC